MTSGDDTDPSATADSPRNPDSDEEADGQARTRGGINPIIDALVGYDSHPDGSDLQSLNEIGDDAVSMEFDLFEQTPGLLGDREAMGELIDAYGVVRGYFIAHPTPYRSLQRSLDQARWGTTYDRYLTRLVYLTFAVALCGVLLGGALSWVLAGLGVFESVSSPIGRVGLLELLPRWVVSVLADSRSAIGSVLLTIVVGSLFAAGTWYGGLFYPSQRASGRERNIDFVLPDAIVFMYALSESGMNLVDIIDKLADSQDAYGDVAAEFDTIRRDVTVYGNDLYTSLRNARNLTPSRNLEKFLDDLLSLLDSGGDVTTFLGDQGQTYLDRAKEEQADFLNLLSMMSEVFIVGFVATPLFLIVILMVISLLGGNYLTEMAILIYVGLPLGFLGFGVFLSVLLEPYIYDEITLDVPDEGPAPESGRAPASGTAEGPAPGATAASGVSSERAGGSSPTSDEEFVAFARLYRVLELRRTLFHPLAFFRADPFRTLLVTAPLTCAYLALLASASLIPFSVEGWTAIPVVVTNRVVVVPFFVLFVPLAVVHELERRRRDEIAERFPDTLNVLSSANSMGISLSDALAVVSQWSSGYYSRELRTVRNDIRWSRDTSGALLRLANRLNVPSLTRTLKLIAEGRRTTTDLSTVLRIAAEDTRNRFRLIRKRRQEMLSYVAVVIVSYLVFVGVILMLEVSYLTPIAELAASSTTTASDAGGPTSLSSVPIDTYRLLFFHAVIVQAIGTGLISGILTDNKLRTGLKYSIALLSVAAIAFTVL